MQVYRLSVFVLLVLAASTYAVFASTDPSAPRSSPTIGKVYSQEMRDTASSQLAKFFRGKSLECRAHQDRSGLFPVTLKAADKGSGRTQLSVATRSGASFSASRNHLKVELDSGWFIIKDGDDDQRFLYLSVANDKIASAITAIRRDNGVIEEPKSVDCKLK